MSSNNKQQILAWFCRHDFLPGIIRFDDALIDAAASALDMDRPSAEAFSAANSTTYWNWLMRFEESGCKRGLESLFIVKDFTSRQLAWRARDFSAPCGSGERARRRLLQSRSSLLRAIDSLNPRHYEARGCVACRLCGGTEVFLTPTGNDSGIDFFAQMPWPGSSHVFSHRGGPLRLVGQCKKYESKVTVEKVKNFVETLNEVRNRNPSVEDLVPGWFRVGSGPILGWIIGHSGFQSGAEDKARNQGILYSDSRDLCEMVLFLGVYMFLGILRNARTDLRR